MIRLRPGDLVPADMRLLRGDGLTVHQSALTGESVPVAKQALNVPDPALSGSGPFAQPQWCFQGSSVTSGSGTAVIVATAGGETLRRSPRRPGRAAGGESSYDRSVQGISWTLIRFMLLTPPLVLMANAALRGRGLETLPFAVAVAVGLTPEMLPVIVTTTLARGAARLARRSGVIVKRLPALHDLGAVDVLCLDKTGTLTEDRPVVADTTEGTDRPDPDVLRWAAVSVWWTLQLADLPAADALDEAVLDAAERYGPSAAGEVHAHPQERGQGDEGREHPLTALRSQGEPSVRTGSGDKSDSRTAPVTGPGRGEAAVAGIAGADRRSTGGNSWV